jgi:hypothetical protein
MASTVPTPAASISEPAPRVHPKARQVDIARWVAYFFLLLGAAVALIPFLYTVSVSLMNRSDWGCVSAQSAAVAKLLTGMERRQVLTIFLEYG